jgi:hypothetical protein
MQRVELLLLLLLLNGILIPQPDRHMLLLLLLLKLPSIAAHVRREAPASCNPDSATGQDDASVTNDGRHIVSVSFQMSSNSPMSSAVSLLMSAEALGLLLLLLLPPVVVVLKQVATAVQASERVSIRPASKGSSHTCNNIWGST